MYLERHISEIDNEKKYLDTYSSLAPPQLMPPSMLHSSKVKRCAQDVRNPIYTVTSGDLSPTLTAEAVLVLILIVLCPASGNKCYNAVVA